ncbi:MAG: GIY-YIG nuclease family protein [Patescibacteria group bacterium]
MGYTVYVLKNLKGELYIGQTKNIDDRIARHNSGRSLSTKNKGPYALIHKEEYGTRAEAIKREKELKSGQGRKWIKENF